jgi:pimeloyl-ACP methyl ester carboxylesterase
MLEVSHHIDEIDPPSGGQPGVPASWRAAASEGTPTLYVHGVPNSSLMWQPFLERTGGEALDLPGFGDAVKAATFPFSIAGYDGYIERFLDWRELDRVNLVMHDWGAAALAFAQRAPERVERIVLIDALPLFDGHEWYLVARIWRTPVLGELAMGCLTPRLLRRVLRYANAKPLPERELREMYETLDFGTQRAILKLYRSVKTGTLGAAGAHLDRIEAPALIVWGELDPYNPAGAAEQYAHALGGESEVVTLDGAGHWPWLDRPELLDSVADFLTQS